MKRMKLHLPRLSRPQRIVWNLFVSLLLLVFIWWTFGCPLPLMTQFRLAERKMLVGPSEILAVVRGEVLHLPEIPTDLDEYQASLTQINMVEDMRETEPVIVGEQDEILIWSRSGGCRSREKTGEVTLWPISTYVSRTGTATGEERRVLSGAIIVVQTDLAKAYHARLEWRDFVGADDYDTNWCRGTGTVQGDGVFVIPVFQSSEPVTDNEGINGRFDLAEAHLVLTDENGTVIYDKVLIVED